MFSLGQRFDVNSQNSFGCNSLEVSYTLHNLFVGTLNRSRICLHIPIDTRNIPSHASRKSWSLLPVMLDYSAPTNKKRKVFKTCRMIHHEVLKYAVKPTPERERERERERGWKGGGVQTKNRLCEYAAAADDDDL